MAEVLLTSIAPTSATTAHMAYRVHTSAGTITIPIEVTRAGSLAEEERECLTALHVIFSEGLDAVAQQLEEYPVSSSALGPLGSLELPDSEKALSSAPRTADERLELTRAVEDFLSRAGKKKAA